MTDKEELIAKFNNDINNQKVLLARIKQLPKEFDNCSLRFIDNILHITVHKEDVCFSKHLLKVNTLVYEYDAPKFFYKLKNKEIHVYFDEELYLSDYTHFNDKGIISFQNLEEFISKYKFNKTFIKKAIMINHLEIKNYILKHRKSINVTIDEASIPVAVKKMLLLV